MRKQIAVRLALMLIALALLAPAPDTRAAGPAFLVKDIAPGAESPTLFDLTNVNRMLFFRHEHDGGQTLWKSDGTEAGTVAVKTFDRIYGLTNVGGTLFFGAEEVNSLDGLGTAGVWKSDGTPDGTILLKTFPKNQPYSPLSSIAHLTDVNSTLFFVSNFDTAPQQLWRSDGTTDGTILLKSAKNIDALTNADGVLYFRTFDSGTGGLWRSDGTEAGTTLIKEIAHTYTSEVFGRSLSYVNGTLFFANNDTELWKTDGTVAGTTYITTIPETGALINNFINVQGTLFFFANELKGNDSYVTLWKSDGTATGTRKIEVFRGLSMYFPIYDVKRVNDTLFLSSFGNQHGKIGIEKIHRTQDTTTFIKEIFTLRLSSVCGTLFFSNQDGINPIGLWKSDGTAEGTRLVQYIVPNMPFAGPTSALTVAGRLAFFAASDGTNASQLWAMPLPTATFTPTTSAHQLFLPLISNRSPSYDGSCG